MTDESPKSPPVLHVEPLLIGTAELAALLNVGKTNLHTLRSLGRLPLPIRLGRRVLWRRSEIERWVEAGCPHLEKWLAMQEQKGSM